MKAGETRAGVTAADWLARILALPLDRKPRILNVCGGHERTITHAGIRSALANRVELIPGPGCPVCICPEEDVYAAIELGLQPGLTVLAFGDMLRVPVNVPRREPRSLEQAKAAGGDVRPVASPAEAAAFARAHPDRTVVFFAAGFETTMAPVAAMLAQAPPDNLRILLAGRRTWPAVSMLLEADAPGFEALIAPGHVATVMGAEEWAFVPERHGLPAAVAGFEAESLLAGIYSTLQQLLAGEARLVNCYPQAVRPGGNAVAQRLLDAAFDVVDANWRGIGTIPASGYALRAQLAARDARPLLPASGAAARKRAGEMPPGCDCARVVLGRIYPNECQLYGVACTPRRPVGPCMVSDEGACRLWWSGGIRENAAAGARASGAD